MDQGRSTVTPPSDVAYVYRSDGQLLARNITIADRDELNRLKDLGASQFVMDNKKRTPQSEDATSKKAVPSENLTVVEKSHDKIHAGIKDKMELYDDTLALMKELFPKVEEGELPEDSLDRIKDSIHEIIDEARTRPAVIGALTQLKTYDDYTFQHSLNVSLLTTLYGVFRNFDRREIAGLALAALFHDIGKLDVPQEIIQSRDRLSPDQRKVIEDHPGAGREVLSGIELDDVVRTVAYEHHERPDGSGYPEGIQSIHLYSRITSVCDVYEALTARRAYKEPFHPLQAFSVLKEEFSEYMETRKVVSGLIHSLGIFPVGSFVELNSGERGFVSKNHREDLRRPEIIITTDRKGSVLSEPYPVDLLKAAKRKYGIHREIYDDKTFVETILPIRDHPYPEDKVASLLEEYVA